MKNKVSYLKKIDKFFLNKRQHFRVCSLFFVLLLILCVWSFQSALAAQSPQIPIAGSAIPQFMQELPTLSTNTQSIPKINTVFGNTSLTIRMCELDAQVLPPGAIGLGQVPTRVWGYIVDPTGTTGCPTTTQDTYIGPVIVNQRSTASKMPTTITWVNDLGNVRDTQVLAYKYSTDQTLHWADPLAPWTMANMCMMDMCNKTTGTCTYSVTPCASDTQCTSMFPAFGSQCSLNYGQDPANPGTFLNDPIPAVVHLHGGEVPAEIDGSPDSWFTSSGGYQGHKYYSFAGAGVNEAIYKYPNTQEAAPLWFHDHTLGATRLNVYAGLAGAYFIYDPDLNLPLNLHPLTEVVPLVIQDRMFDTNGQLFFQADSNGGILWTTNPEHPYWSPEFVGDSIVVNGKAWPYMKVDPKRYRFLFLNGSNARTYEMFLINQTTGAMGPAIWVIGTDGGYLNTPQKIDPALGQKLVMQPGERYEVIIDFSGFPGTNLIIRNTGRTPYPKGAPPQGSTLGRIVQFRVNAAPVTDNSYNPASGTPLRTGTQMIVRLTTNGVPPANPAKTRQLTLNEVMGMPMTVTDPVTGLPTAYPGGPLEILVNNTKWSGMSPRTYNNDFTSITVNGVITKFSELPKEGDTEVWEVVNLTADAHPIHLHLVQVQLINRQNFNVSNYTAAYNALFPAVTGDPVCTGGVFCPAFGPPLDYNTGNTRALGGNPDIAAVNKKGKPIYLQGPVQPPAPYEAGWKDTVVTYPGQVTRIAVRWAPTDLLTNAAAADLHYPFDPTGDNWLCNYVWHCHIIDHEDNEMMRPDVVELNTAAPVATRLQLKGWDY